MDFAGASLIASQFGAGGGATVRALSLVETVAGLGTVALLISYLPALYGAYRTREARLLTLDHPDGGRLAPVQLIVADRGDLERYHRFCAEWEMWTAEVLESHVSYPMLAVFRSQHAGQSWITALGVVMDSATLACACIQGEDVREPYHLHRRGRRAVLDIAARLDVAHRNDAVSWLTRENFDRAWLRLETLGVPLHDPEDAFARLRALYGTYGTRLQDLIDHLLAPHGFWGHSAEATVEAEVAIAEQAARQHARRTGSGGSAR